MHVDSPIMIPKLLAIDQLGETLGYLMPFDGYARWGLDHRKHTAYTLMTTICDSSPYCPSDRSSDSGFVLQLCWPLEVFNDRRRWVLGNLTGLSCGKEKKTPHCNDQADLRTVQVLLQYYYSRSRVILSRQRGRLFHSALQQADQEIAMHMHPHPLATMDHQFCRHSFNSSLFYI